MSSVSIGQAVADSILHDGDYRHYRLFAPSGFTPAENPALVLNLHGLGSNSEQQEAYSLMNVVAQEERFLVCYVDGVNDSWNLGLGSNDDVGLIGALIDRFALTHGVDEERVYACGMSQGGYFSFVLACQLSDRIAAIATVAASMAQGLTAICAPPRPVPVFMINGTADAIVPYTGGLQNIAVDAAMSHWVTQNGCATPAQITSLPDAVTNDGCTATRANFGACALGTEVDLIAVIGGGHTWPGAAIPIGVTCQDFDGSTEIWRFFERFSLNGAVGVREQGGSRSSVAPVPATETLIIRIDGIGPARLVVRDELGRVVMESGLVSGAATDITDLAAGRYVTSVVLHDRVEHHPVIIAR